MNVQMFLCTRLQHDKALRLSNDTMQQTDAVVHVLLCGMAVRLSKARLGSMRRIVQVLLDAICAGITAGVQ